MARVRELPRGREICASRSARAGAKGSLGRGFWDGEVSFLLFAEGKLVLGGCLFLAFPAEILGGKGFKKGGEGT